LSDESVDVA